MAISLVKVLVSAAVISVVSSLAKKQPMWAGWIAALPLVTLLSIAWLMAEKQRNEEITHLVSGVLLGMVPTALLLLGTWISLKKGIGVLPSVGIGVIIWVIYTLVFKRIA